MKSARNSPDTIMSTRYIRHLARLSIWPLGIVAQPFTFLAHNVGHMWYRNAVVSILLLVCFALRSRRQAVKDHESWRRPWPMWAALLTGIVCGGLLLAASHVGYHLVSSVWPGIHRPVHALYSRVNSPPGIPWVFALLPIAVVAEEIFWRDEVITRMTQQSNPSDIAATLMPIVVAAGVYALTVASSGSVILVIAAVILGILWGIQRVITGTLVVPVMTHLIWNVGLFFLWPVI